MLHICLVNGVHYCYSPGKYLGFKFCVLWTNYDGVSGYYISLSSHIVAMKISLTMIFSSGIANVLHNTAVCVRIFSEIKASCPWPEV